MAFWYVEEIVNNKIVFRIKTADKEKFLNV